jgi:fatty-acyl-CoA synthase
VHRTANLFADIGVGRASAVALLAPNCQGLLTAILAAETVGIAAPINPGLSVEHARTLAKLAEARVLVVAGPELSEQAWALGRELATTIGATALLALRPCAAAGYGPDLEPIDGITVAYLDEAAATQPADRLVGTAPPVGTDIASYFHTGGTTGTPKLAAHTHANEVANAWMIAANGDLDENSVLFAAHERRAV